MSNLDAIRARPTLAGRRRSERTCCLVFKDRCASRALPPRPVQARKKPLRRRGPKTARDCGVRPIRLSAVSSSIRSQPPLPEATGEFSNISGPPNRAAERFPARPGEAGDGIIGAIRTDPGGPLSGRQADPPELAPAHLQDRARRAGRPRRRARPAPSGSPSRRTPPWPSSRRASLRETPKWSASRAGRCTTPSSRLAARRPRPPRSPRAAGARGARGRSGARRPSAASGPWKRSTSRRAEGALLLHRRQRGIGLVPSSSS